MSSINGWSHPPSATRGAFTNNKWFHWIVYKHWVHCRTFTSWREGGFVCRHAQSPFRVCGRCTLELIFFWWAVQYLSNVSVSLELSNQLKWLLASSGLKLVCSLLVASDRLLMCWENIYNLHNVSPSNVALRTQNKNQSIPPVCSFGFAHDPAGQGVVLKQSQKQSSVEAPILGIVVCLQTSKPACSNKK